MAEGLTRHEQYLRRIDSLALSSIPVPEGIVAAPSRGHNGAMVALVPSNPDDLALDGDDALTADDLHVTLCYFGKADDMDSFERSRILRGARRACEASGHAFSTTADGVIIMGSNSEGVPATAYLVQADEIVGLYDSLVRELGYESKYPSFIPHMTAGYGVRTEAAQDRVGTEVQFDTVVVKFGDDRYEIPLDSGLVAAPRGANVIDRVIDSLGRLWDEALHPRGSDGRFIKKNGAVSGKLSVVRPGSRDITKVDANRASVIGFHTFDNDVWVLAEITNADGSKVQGFARADEVNSTAPVKARLDALYPVTEDDSFVESATERARQLDLLMARVYRDYGVNNDTEGAQEFLESLGLWEQDMNHIQTGGNDEYLGGLRKVDRDLTPDEQDEVEDIIDDARQVKELRDRVRGLQDSSVDQVQSVNELMDKYDERGVDSFVSERDDRITLSKIVVPERSRGVGTEFMDELTDYADRTGKRIDLTPSDDFGGNKNRLIEFYKRFDFVENKGRNRDFEVSEDMYRLPEDVPDIPSGPSIEEHTTPRQQIIDTSGPSQEAVESIRSGADPLTVDTANLLAAMDSSGRFEEPEMIGNPGVSPIGWRIDPEDQTGNNVRLAGTTDYTTGRAYFVKQSVIGADMHNSDVVREVLTSLMSEQLTDDLGDDNNVLPVPRSRFGENPVWDGEISDGGSDPFNIEVHQPAYVVSDHADYAVPSDWDRTTMSDEETALYNDIRDFDTLGKEDAKAAYYEDAGDIYGNSIAQMVLFDFLIQNGDRNPGNAILAAPLDGGEGRALPIDHGFAFGEDPFAEPGDAPSDIGSLFNWFMNYHFSEAWMRYVYGGLDLNENVTPATLRRVISEFVDTYSRIKTDEIKDRFRSMPNVSDAQMDIVTEALSGVQSRIEWMQDNVEEILRRMTTRP